MDEFIKPCIFNLTSESLKIDSVSFQKMLRVLRVKLNNIIYCQLWKMNIYVYGLELSLYQVPSLFLSFFLSIIPLSRIEPNTRYYGYLYISNCRINSLVPLHVQEKKHNAEILRLNKAVFSYFHLNKGTGRDSKSMKSSI